MMIDFKLSLIWLLFGLLILASCREAPTPSLAEEKAEILGNAQPFSKSYYGGDSARLASIYQDSNRFVLRLHFPPTRSYEQYGADLESLGLALRQDGLRLDSLDEITMYFFGNHPGLLAAFSSIPAVQEELAARDRENRRFLDHDRLGQALEVSEELAAFLSLLGIQSTSNAKVVLEKCRSERIDSQNVDPQGRHFDLYCAHLFIALR